MSRNNMRTLFALAAIAAFLGPAGAAQAAAISYAGNQIDVESNANTPTEGWRNTTPYKPLDIDGDSVLGTDGWALYNSKSDPSYATVTLNSLNAWSGGLWDNPADPSGPDTLGGKCMYDYSSASSRPFAQFVVGGNNLDGKTLRLGVLVDVMPWARSGITYTLTQTVGGVVSASTPSFNTDADGALDVWFFDISEAVAGDTFAVTAYAAGKYHEFAGLTFDTVGTACAYWDVDGAGVWDAGTTNWNPAPDGSGTAAVWTPGVKAVFSAGSNGTGSYAVTVDAAQDISGLEFTQGTVTLTGGALRMMANSRMKVADGLTANIETPITENAAGRSLIKDGAGTLVISGANSYTGITEVQAGTLRLGASDVIPATAVKVAAKVAGVSATLDLNGNSHTIGSLTLGGAANSSAAVTTGGAGTLTLGGDVTYDAVKNPLGATISGNVALGAAERTFTVGDSTAATDDLTVSANISGDTGVGLTKAGAGTLVLSGTNSYDGATTITGGTVRFESAAAVGSTTSINPSAGTTVVAGFDIGQSFLGLMAGDTDAFTVALGANGTQNLDLSAATGANLPNVTIGATTDVYYSGMLTAEGGTYRLGGGGGTLNLANANALTGGNSLVVGGNVTLAAGNDYSGPTTVNAGTLNVNASLASPAINVSGGGLNLNSPWTGTTLAVTGGATVLGAPGTTVNTADFSAGTGAVDATNGLAVTNQMILPGGTTVTTSGPSMQVSGSNIASNVSGRTIAVSGGTVTMVGVAESGPLNLSSTGLNIADSTHVKASPYYATDGRAPWRTSDWSGMTGTFPNATAVSATPANTMWLSNNSTGAGTWISWDLGDLRPINQMHIWNYNESGAFHDRGVRTLTLETSTDGVTWTAVPGLSSTIDWNNIGTDGTITGTVQGTATTSYAGFDWILPETITTQYLRFNNTLSFKCFTNPANTDKYTGLSEVVFYMAGDVKVALPTTNILATSSTTLDLSNPAADHLLGSLTLTGAGTALTVANAASVSFAGINGAADSGLDLGAATALTLNVADGQSASFAGTLANTAGDLSLTKTGAGTQVLTGSYAYTGATTVSGGTLSVTGSITASDLTVTDGGALAGSGSVASAAVEAGGRFTWGYGDGGDHTIDVVGDLSLAGSWVIKLVDLGNDPLTNGQYELLSYGGSYTGASTFTSALANIVIDAAEAPGWNIDNLSITASGGHVYISGIGVEGTPGDTNEDKVVDAADFITLKKNFSGGAGAGSEVGNFDNSGTVDWADLSTLMTNMGSGGPAPATTPEPATLGLLAIGALAVIRRRRAA